VTWAPKLASRGVMLKWRFRFIVVAPVSRVLI
jgi:hypothetical protein